MHPRLAWLSVGFFIFWAAIHIVGTLVMLLFAPPGEKLGGILMVWCLSTCWGPFLAIAAYLFVSARRYRLFLGEDAFYERGAIKEHFVAVAEVQQLMWKAFPDGGTIVAIGSFGKVEVSLMLLPAVDRPQVISWFRERIPDELQSGWHNFETWILPSPEVRRRWWWRKVAIYAVAAAILATAWFAGLISDRLIVTVVVTTILAQLFRRLFLA